MPREHAAERTALRAHAERGRTLACVPTLVLKIALTPILIAVATVVGRRWGPGVGGWLVGLPLTSAPVALFLALDHGTGFAAAAAAGSLVGAAAEAGFCTGYVLGAGMGWIGGFAGGTVGFLVASALLLPATALPLVPLALLVALVLFVSVRLLPRDDVVRAGVVAPRWDLGVRMVVGAVLVVAITALAPFLGPHMSGIAAAFPVFATVLTVFAHRAEGLDSARQVLRGLLVGLFAFGAFFVVLGSTIEPDGIAVSFLLATAAALLVQAISVRLVRTGGGDESTIAVQRANLPGS